MIGSCSSAGRSLKLDRSSKAGKTLATTCKAKKAAAKSKPVAKAVVKKTAPKPVVKKVAVKPAAKKVAKKRVVMLKPKAVTKSTTKKEEKKKYIPYSGPVNSFRDFNEYARKRIEQYPELKQDIVDFYYLAKEEIEDGNSEQNEVSLGYNSIEDIIKGNVY